MSENPVRYSVITEKNPREILMLRGSGCKWRRCTFCDYHLDFSKDEKANFELNKTEIEKVTGLYHKLEVINSGSFCDLDQKTMAAILEVCQSKQINEIHFETHWMHREEISSLRERFGHIGVDVKMKIGVETFDEDFRETVFRKGMVQAAPEDIAKYCDEVCLLFGFTGQSPASMKYDIETGLQYFERVCVNIMVENTTKMKPDSEVIRAFLDELYPLYRENPRVDLLLNNTDFGVGGENNAE